MGSREEGNSPLNTKNISEVHGNELEQLSRDVADMGLVGKGNQDLELMAKNNNTKLLQQEHVLVNNGRGQARAQSTNRFPGNNYVSPPRAAISQKMEPALNGATMAAAASKGTDGSPMVMHEVDVKKKNDGEEEEDDDVMNEFDEDDYDDSDDSDSNDDSYDIWKINRWFVKFFKTLCDLSNEEIQKQDRSWHCPACQPGPGSIDWYKGLSPLLTHAKTKGSSRVKLHRKFAEALKEELQARGIHVTQSGEVYGKWKAVTEEEKDHQIVWPPMVVVMNTKLEQDDNEKWIGMGNQELLDCFSGYAAEKARHSYGPSGHRGMSLLTFEASLSGYLEAERLHKHFEEKGTDRIAWDRRRVIFLPGGKRQLYGYLATKEDLEVFGQHSQGKSKIKYEMKSYQEMVVQRIQQISQDTQQLHRMKDKVDKEKRHSKALEESMKVLCDKLRKSTNENRIVRQRTRIHHEQNKEELDAQEQFFKEQIKLIRESSSVKEQVFERQQEDQLSKVMELNASSISTREKKLKFKKIKNFIKVMDEEMEKFVVERDDLINLHEQKMAELRKQHLVEELELEKQLDSAISSLMEKYTPSLPPPSPPLPPHPISVSEQ